MEQGEKKTALCRVCKAPLDLEICHSIVDRWPHTSLDDILPGGQCDYLNWEACPNAGDDLHLKASLARELNRLDFCSICGRRVRDKGDYTWSDHPRTAKAVEELLGYSVPVKHVHHTSYSPEKTMIVCDSCHAKIHHSDDIAFTQYRPKLPKKWYRVTKRQRLHKGRVLHGLH